MSKYKICSLDVWGNENDGYDINDYFTIGFVDLDQEKLEDVLKKYLIGSPKRYEIRDECNGFLEVTYKGKPVLHFYEIEEK